jgi:hypothetical protein
MRQTILSLSVISAVLGGVPALAQDNPPIGGVTSPPNAMIFYVARGPAGACGNGCSEWIAAEGAVQWDSNKRLIALLDRIGERKLPVVINVHVKDASALEPAAAIGRLIRARGLDASVAATAVKSCAGVDEAACLAAKRAGKSVDATLDTSSVLCSNACVLILAGGVNRTLPSAAQVILSGIEVRNRLGPKVPDAHAEGVRSRQSERERLHFTQMGLSEKIVDIIDRSTETRQPVKLKPEQWLQLRIVTAISL